MDREDTTFRDSYFRCADCGLTFLFSKGEARFWASKDMPPPKRCRPCRERRRATINHPGDEHR